MRFRSRMLGAGILGLVASAGCAAPAPETCASPGQRLGVLTRMGFVTQRPQGTSLGFDLDGRVSTTNDEATCYQPDFVDPDGGPGIDNQLALLVPLIEQQTGGLTVEAIVQGAINRGQLLVSVGVEHLDDPTEDPCVELVFRTLSGPASVGSDGMLNANQTFDVVPDAPVTRTRAALHNGVVEAGPFELPLPVAILDARFTLHLHGARVRARISEEGVITGIIGGALTVSDVADIARGLGIPASLMSVVATSVAYVADLDPVDAQCSQVSAALTFTANPAFLFPQP